MEVAESNTPTKKARAPKVLDHLELHPKMGGGTIVKHVYANYEHEPTSYSFNKSGVAKGGEHIVAHLTKHAGLPAAAASESGEEMDEEATA
jgi:hypothetical protein